MTLLPEPDFIERDPDKITKEWIELYEKKSERTLQPAQIERLMIDVAAYRESLVRVEIQETAKKNLLSYAPIDILQHIGEPLGVEQLKARYSKTKILFQVDEPLDFEYEIPQKTEIETKDGLFTFETIETVTLPAGDLSVEIEAICQTAGAAANNYATGSINNLLTPLDYINNVSNTTVSSDGADDEDVESLRERIRQAPEKFSNAGSVGAYKYHAFSANQNIIDVAVISPSPGVVNIYPLMIDGNPSEEVIFFIQNYLSSDYIRPLTDFVEVKSPVKVSFEISAIITLYTYADEETVVKTINSRLGEYKKVLSKNLGKSVVKTQIISILNSVYGVFSVKLLFPEDIEICKNEWAYLENYFIAMGGYADE